MKKYQNGLNMIDLKILNMLQREVLEQYIKQFVRMDLLIIGIMKLINGVDIKKIGVLL